MSPEESAALIAAGITLVGILTNIIFINRDREKRHIHEINIEHLKAELIEKMEKQRELFNEQLKKEEYRLKKELENIQSELNRREDLYKSTIPLQQQIRDHIAVTRTLLGRVFVSFNRLSIIAPSLNEDDVLIEATNTLDLYAEYRQHLLSDKVVSYPETLQSILKEIQKILARIFLDLQIDETSRNDSDVAMKIKGFLNDLEVLKDSCMKEMDRTIKVHLDILS
ncbi:MAG: hypothetical protein JNM58_06005 [Xanthomonadaceae bacterium]|nr:hypothetical protein [Xanthomonadaceae bacterium]